MKKRILIILFLFSTVLFSQTVHLKIIETTDTHGAIFPYDFTDNKPDNHSLAQIYTYVKEQRADKKQDVLLFSDGDLLQGTPDVYYYNYIATNKKHLYAEVMNYMKYDVATVGNHDIEAGHSVYDKMTSELNFPWLAANAIREDNGKTYFPPYYVTERSGVKIAVLGMITPGIPNWLPKVLWTNIYFADMIETAKKWVPIIQKKEHPDLLIGLFHSGVDPSYGGETKQYMNENASKLVAEQVPGFDIVFVGHDHHGWNFSVKNSVGDSVKIIGGTHSAIVFGVADVYLTKDKNGWKKSIKSKLVKTKNYKPDEGFIKTFKPQFEAIKNWVNKPIGKFTESVKSSAGLFGESKFVDLIQSLQLKISGAEISFASPLAMNTEIKKGKIYVRDMFKLYHYENFLYTMRLSGKEIKGFLEYSASNWFNQMKSENDDLLKFKLDKNGKKIISERNNRPLLYAPFYNFASAAGIKYSVDVSKPEGERINILSMQDGSPFDLSKEYSVAVNSYRGNGGGGHLVKGAGIPHDELSKRIIKSTDRDLRFLMMKNIEKEKVIYPKLIGNWKIIPESWAEKGKEKDYKLLFGK
jgi:2',3'-cyclic-nucleotide 2'-phosphodiesterase/3'-nucleotidase